MSEYIIKNDRITLAVDQTSGAIRSLAASDIQTDLAAYSFTLTADGKTYFTGSSAVSYTFGEDFMTFTYSDPPYSATLRYVILPDCDFIERELSFTRDDGQKWTCDSVSETVHFAESADEIIFHDDQSLWHVPTNYFVRYPSYSVMLGLEYPYWDNVPEDGSGAGLIASRDTVALAYSPKYTVSDGESFTAERTFIGLCRKTGHDRVSSGAYPSKQKLPFYPDMFKDGGANQHFVGNKTPDDAGLPTETLDWGEVWAMQDFFRHHLPVQPLPEDGYWVWQNGWWAGLFNPDINLLDPLIRAGVRDLMTAAIYYGHDNHPTTEPKYIRDMRISPLGFPVTRHASEGVTEGGTGWHSLAEKASGEADVVDYSETFEAPPVYDDLVREAEKRGVYISSFSTPNNTYLSRPEWCASDENGKAYEYFGTRLSCPACEDYMDFHFDMLTRVLDRYHSRFWAFDGRWMNYSEIAGYHFGYIGATPCHDPSHGHPVGDSRYKEWKNIEKFKRKLRERYPNMCLEEYYGLKRGGIWSMTSLNSDENYYEMASVENNRLQTWHNENDRFRPVYINYSSVFGTTPSEFEHSLISALSTSAYCQISKGYAALRDYPECADTLKRWKKWADENHRFLMKRRAIFGMPGEKAADGSAHIIGDEGYIFIFSVPGKTVEANIPLDSFIGLDGKAEAYRVNVTASVSRDGSDAVCVLASDVLRPGDTLTSRITADTAVILHIEPCGKDTSGTSVTLDAADETVYAY